MGDFDQAQTWTAADDFLAQARAHPARPALTVAGETLSYGALCARAETLAASIARSAPEAGAVAIYGTRTADTYAAILAILMRGAAYVPAMFSFKRPFARDHVSVLRLEGGSELGE